MENSATKKRKLLLEFIKLYRQFPELWKIKSKAYTDRFKKNIAYNVLVQKYNEIEPGADKEIVKKKINTLRTNFRKELRKVLESERADAVYIPTLWYYGELVFLIDQDMPSQGLKTVEEHEQLANYEIIIKSETQDELLDQDKQNYEEPTAEEYTQQVLPQVTRNPKRKYEGTHQNEPATLPCEYLHQSDDEFDHIAKIWAADLRKLEKDQLLFAKKAINDILFEGQLGTLDRYSVTINQNRSVPYVD